MVGMSLFVFGCPGSVDGSVPEVPVMRHDLPLVPRCENVRRRKESFVAPDFEQFSGQPASFDRVLRDF